MGCGDIVMKFLDSKRAALVVPAEDEEVSVEELYQWALDNRSAL